MSNYEIIGVTKTTGSYDFEIMIEGCVRSFWLVMPTSMYNQMTSEQVKSHITRVVEGRCADMVITTEDSIKLDEILGT